MPIVALALTLHLSACSHEHYTVEIAPADAGFQRTISIEEITGDRPGQTPSDDVLDPIRKIYGAAVPDTPATFRATFEESTPADIGGHGSFVRSTTTLGTVFVYLEQFRGDDDLVRRISRIENAVSTLHAVLLAWLDAALEGQPAWPAFRATLADGSFERDLQNLALMGWLERNGAQDYDTLLARITAYLHKRGHLTAPEVAGVASSLDGGGTGVEYLLFNWLARGLGLTTDEERSALVAALEREDVSWETWLGESPEALRRLRSWAQQAGILLPVSDEDEAEPEAVRLSERLMAVVLGTEPTDDGGTGDTIDLALSCPVEPTMTNGEWSDEDGKVSWSFKVEPSPDDRYLVPAVALAVWAVPDTDFQQEHFGVVILAGEKLVEYVSWYASLSPAQAERWDEALDAIATSDDPISALREFDTGLDPTWNDVQNGIVLLREALHD